MEHSPPLGQAPRVLLGGGGPGRFKLSPFEIITLGAIVLIAAFIGYSAYAKFTDLNAVPPPSPTYIPAFRTTLTSTVSSTGTVASTQQVSLNFDIGQGTGKIQQFFVKLGDRVTAGQPLAKLDDSDLTKTLTSTRSNLAAAQSRLSAVTSPTASDVSSAQQAVAAAQSQVLTAQNNLQKLRNPTPSDVASAQQAITSAQQSLLITAQNSVTTAQNAIATAQATVSTSQNDLTTAQISAGTAYSALQTAYSQVLSSGCQAYVPGVPIPGQVAQTATLPPYAFPSSAPTPVLALNGTQTNTTPPYANNILNPNCSTSIGSYNSAVNGHNGAVATLVSRQTTLQKAQNDLNNGNLNNSVVQAQASVLSAQSNIQAAQAKYDALLRPQQSDIDAAQASLNSAQASLTAAQARQNALFSPTPDQVLPLQATVDQAQAQVSTAEKNLAAATITAPFDGVIAQVTGDVGSLVTANSTVFILLNQALLRIDANVDQVDLSNLRQGQVANTTFDALPGRVFQATIIAVGLTPTIQQGVVTYTVQLSLDTSRLTPPLPAPGMTASITVTTQRTDNALVVPTRAIRRVAGRASITVKKADGTEETRQVVTGVSNNQLTQVTSGLTDGEPVLVSSTATARTNAALPGGIQVPTR